MSENNWVDIVNALLSAASIIGIKLSDEQKKSVEAWATARALAEYDKIEQAVKEAKARLEQGKEEPK